MLIRIGAFIGIGELNVKITFEGGRGAYWKGGPYWKEGAKSNHTILSDPMSRNDSKIYACTESEK